MRETSAIISNSSAAVRARCLRWAVLGRDRSLPHFGRKIYHAAMGLLCAGLYGLVLDREGALRALAIIGGMFVVLDLVRLRFTSVNQFVLRTAGNLMRREELKSISGNTFYVLGLVTVLLFFSKPIALLSVLFLALGDPVAAVVGTLYGKHKLIAKKSVEGALANFTLCALASFLFGVFALGHTLSQALMLAVVGGTISMLAELIPLPIDDNFTIPVFSAIFLSIASCFLPLFA